MAYAIVTKSNVLYQPRENIKTLLLTNLTDPTIQIYSKFPNMKDTGFKGFPFIVLPDADQKNIGDYHGTSTYEFSDMIEGTVYHEGSKLGDNKLRTAKQDIINAVMGKANRKTLSGYGVKDLSIEFGRGGSEDYVIEDQMQLYPAGFTISYNVEVNFG